MSVFDDLAKLRPLMTRAEITSVLGPEHTKAALNQFSGFDSRHKVNIIFSHADEVLDSISFTAGFPDHVAICGFQIGQSLKSTKMAMPSLALPPGATGEPNAHGFIFYHVKSATLGFEVQAAVKEGAVAAVTLTREDFAAVLELRKRREAERVAERARRIKRAARWKTIENLDDMLLHWAKFCSPWGGSPQPFVEFAEWLIGSKDPDAWHVVSMSWNWDYEIAPLLWITRQKECDLATALHIFFLGQPASYLDGVDKRSSLTGHDLEMFDFLSDISRRCAEGFYTRSEIAFDKRKVDYSGPATAEVAERQRRFYPRVSDQPIAGRDPNSLRSAAVDRLLPS